MLAPQRHWGQAPLAVRSQRAHRCVRLLFRARARLYALHTRTCRMSADFGLSFAPAFESTIAYHCLFLCVSSFTLTSVTSFAWKSLADLRSCVLCLCPPSLSVPYPLSPICICISHLHVCVNAAPGAPTAATVTPWSGDSLYVQWAPPLSDGGSQVTGYRVDWDTNPGVLDVQTLQTTPYLGPNEIQSITISAARINDVQSVHTAATNVYTVQTVQTFANLYETLGGSFTLALDTTATGGGYYVSAQINNAAQASIGELFSLMVINCLHLPQRAT